MSLRRIIVVGIVMELCYLSFYVGGEGAGAVLVLIGVHATTFLLLAYLVRQMRRGSSAQVDEQRTLYVIVAFAALFRLTLVPHPIVGSDDIYRYLWDGRVTASGMNPYAYLPTDPRLSHLATADLPAKVNHPEMRSVYPALAQGLFFVSNKIFGESASGLKLLLALIDCATVVLLAATVRRLGGSALPVLLYAWSPLPVLYFGLDGHIDVLGILFLVIALLCFLSRRPIRGSLALGLGALAKLVPLLVVPLLLRTCRGARRVLVLVLPLIILAAGYLFSFDSSGGVFDSLRTFGSRWEFNGSLFSVAYFLTGSNDAAHLISGGLIAIMIAVLAFSRRSLLEKVFWGFTGFLLLAPVVHPWYLTWLAALLVLRWSLAVFVFLGLSTIANVVVYQYRAFGQWNDQPLLLLLEYLPVYILLVVEIVRGEVLRPTSGETTELAE